MISQRISLRQKLRKERKNNDIKKNENNVARIKSNKTAFSKQPVKNIEKPIHSMKPSKIFLKFIVCCFKIHHQYLICKFFA